MIKIKVFAVNPFREVTYVVSDEATKKCVIIDAGASNSTERDRIESYISSASLQPIMLLNTHCHIDHILSINYFKDLYSIPFAASALESQIISMAENSAKMFGIPFEQGLVPVIDVDLSTVDKIEIGESALKVVPTPGHSIGGVCFYDEESKALFTGDTLFNGSIGRTDLPTGDYDVLMKSIIDNILPLGGDVTIYPGHGNHSTLAHEVTYNPFVSEVLNNQVNPVCDED